MERRILLRGGHVYSSVDPFATAMLVHGDTIAWLGDDAGAQAHSDDVDGVVELHGAWVAPAFVDAHVHATATGLLLTGIDLSGCVSLAEMLERLRACTDPSVIGHGWDETDWPEGRPPTSLDLDAVVGNRSCYLSRVDGHSAVVSTATRRAHPDLQGLPGYDPEGPLARDAHHRVREGFTLTAEQRDRAQRATLRAAVSVGIASIHEMAGPAVSSAQDLRSLLDLAREPGMPSVVGYWGELDGFEAAAALGARGVGGDLCVDGSLGSRTACLRAPYQDRPDSCGSAYLEAADVARHVIAASQHGVQAGFHVIGDKAQDIVMEGFSLAVSTVGVDAIRRSRHRIEHCEMPGSHTRAMADWGIVASVQSGFDAAWGGPSGMYAARLGEQRARQLNPLAGMAADGVVLALGSDAPVTPMDPWHAVRAAASHQSPEHRISVRAAFAAHTRGGRRAAAEESTQPGVLVPGAPATYAVWRASALSVHAPDGRIAAWSTDPRSGTPGLPDLSPDQPLPTCLRTVIGGVTAFDSGALA